MNVLVHSFENLVFRDGRPFGDAGTFQGGLLRWPMPSTLAGMVRSRVGLDRDPGFFSRENPERRRENIREIRKIDIGPLLPVYRIPEEGRWRFLYPAPADAQITWPVGSAGAGGADGLVVKQYRLEKSGEDAGCDLPWRNWLLPFSTSREKPPSDIPAFWKEEPFFKWLAEELPGEPIPYDRLGVDWPAVEIRIHTSIDPETGTVRAGHLFASQGIRLAARERNRHSGLSVVELGVAIGLRGLGKDDNPSGVCHLGGDRKTARVEILDADFPGPPAGLANQKFLRLILVTPGDFGGWAPEWLLPAGGESAEETPWVEVPGVGTEVRLRSAFVPRWQAVSGYDYELRAPKATRKLVPPGSVYLVELRSPGDSQALAEKLWLSCLGDGPSPSDGYGYAVVGRTEKSLADCVNS